MNYVIVFIGSGIGGMMRHAVNVVAPRLVGTEFPAGTLFVNVVGSFIIGFVAEYWAVKSGLSQSTRLFLTTGMMGGFTTFSTFSLDTALLWERGQALTAAIYVAASLILSIAALFTALWLVRNVATPTLP